MFWIYPSPKILALMSQQCRREGYEVQTCLHDPCWKFIALINYGTYVNFGGFK